MPVRGVGRDSWRLSPGLALGIFAWLAWSAGLRSLTLPEEGRYVGVAWEMIRSGDWALPTENGLPFFHKPPLFYWLTAGAMRVFGVAAWPARVAPLLAATFAALALFALVRRWSDERRARWTLVVLLTQPAFFVAAQFANLDMLVAACIAGATCFGAHAALRMRCAEPYRAALVAAFACAALGVLAKGLIGLVLPGLVLLVWLLVIGQARLIWRMLSPLGLLVFFAIAGPWFAVMQIGHDGFLHYFFIVQHFTRFTGAGFNNEHGPWFYVVVLPLLTLPWSIGLVASAWHSLAGGRRAAGRPRRGTPTRLATTADVRARGRVDTSPAAFSSPSSSSSFSSSSPSAPSSLSSSSSSSTDAVALRRLMWVWLAVVVVFFSIPRSKTVGYVMPALFPIAALAADAAVSWLDGGGPRRLLGLRVLAALAALACVAAVGVAALTYRHDNVELAATLKRLRSPGEPVVFLRDFFFDVPLLARLDAPVRVIADWHDPAILQHDNWQRELADAAPFAPSVAAATLIDAASGFKLRCGAPPLWVVARTDADPELAAVAGAARIFEARRNVLWRVTAPPCNASTTPEPPR